MTLHRALFSSYKRLHGGDLAIYIADVNSAPDIAHGNVLVNIATGKIRFRDAHSAYVQHGCATRSSTRPCCNANGGRRRRQQPRCLILRGTIRQRAT